MRFHDAVVFLTTANFDDAQILGFRWHKEMNDCKVPVLYLRDPHNADGGIEFFYDPEMHESGDGPFCLCTESGMTWSFATAQSAADTYRAWCI